MVSISLPPKQEQAAAFQKLPVIDEQVLISTYVQPGPGTKLQPFPALFQRLTSRNC